MVNSMRTALTGHVKQSWISIVLVTALLFALLQSYADATWLRDLQWVIAISLISALYGVLLATSSFRGRTALPMNLVMSVAFCALLIGRVVPDMQTLATQSFSASLQLMNVRILTLLDAVRSDIVWVGTGYFIHTQLFEFIFALMLWNASVWLIWCVVRRRQALPGVLPMALIIAVNAALKGDALSVPLFFIAVAVLLTARTAYTANTHGWNQGGVGYPDLIGEDWTIGAVMIAVVVILLSGVSTPEWRDLLERFVRSLQPPPPAQIAATPATISVKPIILLTPSFVFDLSAIGGPIPQSDETIFYVTTSDPPSGMNSEGVAEPPKNQHYWRGAIYDRYTGQGWELLPLNEETANLKTPEAAPDGRYALSQKFEIMSLQDDRLFVASQPVAGGAGTALYTSARDETAVLLRGRTPEYEVTSWAPKATAPQLSADSTDYPAAIRDSYLQLPEDLPQRVRNLAARITQGASSPYDKALRIQEYLRVTYPYRLDVPAPPPRRDVVDYFLFDAPGGFCSYYASAMAVMLRAQGVPARVVTGFATGDYDGRQRKYRVPAKAAHAWVEVYFPTYGWIEFEPTSARTEFNYQSIDTQQSARAPVNLVETKRTGIEQSLLTGIVIAIVLSGAIAAGILLWKGIRQRRLPPDRQAWLFYWQARRSLARVGVAAAGNVTPDEFLTAQLDQLAMPPRLLSAMQQVTELYRLATYSPSTPALRDVENTRRIWRAAWRERLRLRWRHTLAQLRRT